MTPLLWGFVVLGVALVLYVANLLWAIRVATRPRPMLEVGVSLAPVETPAPSRSLLPRARVQLRLSLVTGPREITVNRISLGRELAAATGARPPDGFVEVGHALPAFDDFEPDLAPPPGLEPTDQWMREEKVRQYDEYVREVRQQGKEIITWAGRARVSRQHPADLSIPVRADALAHGTLTLGYYYRVGLVWGHSSVAIQYHGPLGDYRGGAAASPEVSPPR